MTHTALVLGAGMVGTCTALHLRERGLEVTLIDRRPPGSETSYGNAGLIQSEAVAPYAFPREWPFVLRAALGRGADVHWHAQGLWQMGGALWRYFLNSSAQGHARATRAYQPLIALALPEHQGLIAQAQAQALVQPGGFRFVFRTPGALDAALQQAQQLQAQFGVPHQAEDRASLARAEPALRLPLAGALHWSEPWAVREPGALVQRYAALLSARGGQVLRGDAQSLQPLPSGKGWQVQTEAGPVQAEHAVLALGPWADEHLRRLGYRLPLFVKRGYHQHYRPPASAPALRQPVLDAERGYVLAPMLRGLRLTTGAEFAPLHAAPTPVQLAKAQALAQQLLDLGEPLPEPPWLGARPCTADMLPVMGPAPRHPRLWFNFGHAHQGFTLGPVSGRLLAEQIAGETPCLDPTPYLPARFGR